MKKAQAAMEFLMTYGWAILVVLIAIGALAYFGVLNPSRFLPATCTISPGLGCGEFKASALATSNVVIYITNSMGAGLGSVAITLKEPDGDACTAIAPVITAIADGATVLTTWTCNDIGATSAGNRFKGDIGISYTKSGETLSHSTIGTIVAKVE